MAIGKLSFFILIISISLMSETFWRIIETIFCFDSYLTKSSEMKRLLIVGVMSAQDHFKERESIRNTWGKLIDHELIDLKFLIGSKICSVPPADRITPYRCEKWLFNFSPVSNLSTATVENVSYKSFEGFTGFTFIVKHNITVVKLGVHTELFKSGGSKRVRVLLFDAASGDKIASATFISDNYSDTDFIWKTVRSIQLPKDFEGELRVTTDRNISINCSSNTLNKGVVQIFELLKNDKFINFKKTSCLLVGFHYFVENEDNLKNFMAEEGIRQINWNKEMKNIKYHLEIENRAYKDILFINIIDVYKNLSYKLFEFLKWAHTNGYKYILKTDDDVFIDIRKVSSVLMYHSSDDWDWWSCFRKGFPPPNYGKWRDRLFDRKHYPLFPSGAGYIITDHVAKSIVSKNNVEAVTAGEDVSLGVWIHKSLNNYPKRLNTTFAYWACGITCFTINPCNVPELNWQEMHQVMHLLTSSQPICRNHSYL